MWGTFLSEPLPIVALVGRYPANKLIGRIPIRCRRILSSHSDDLMGQHRVLIRFSPGYPRAAGRLDTRYSPVRRSPSSVASNRHAAPRLACVKPVASVHPEPGSNSSQYNFLYPRNALYNIRWRGPPEDSETGNRLTCIQSLISLHRGRGRLVYHCTRDAANHRWKRRRFSSCTTCLYCKSFKEPLSSSRPSWPFFRKRVQRYTLFATYARHYAGFFLKTDDFIGFVDLNQ